MVNIVQGRGLAAQTACWRGGRHRIASLLLRDRHRYHSIQVSSVVAQSLTRSLEDCERYLRAPACDLPKELSEGKGVLQQHYKRPAGPNRSRRAYLRC